MERTQLDTETDNCIQYDSAKIDEIMYEKVIDSIGNSTKCIKFKNFTKFIIFTNSIKFTKFTKFIKLTKIKFIKFTKYIKIKFI